MQFNLFSKGYVVVFLSFQVPDDTDVYYAQEGTEQIEFPMHIVNVIFQQVFRSNFLQSADEKLVVRYYPTAFAHSHFQLELIGPYINLMLPKVLSSDKDWAVNKLFPGGPNCATQSVAVYWMAIPEGIQVTENKYNAGKFDVFLCENAASDFVHLVPKSPNL